MSNKSIFSQQSIGDALMQVSPRQVIKSLAKAKTRAQSDAQRVASFCCQMMTCFSFWIWRAAVAGDGASSDGHAQVLSPTGSPCLPLLAHLALQLLLLPTAPVDWWRLTDDLSSWPTLANSRWIYQLFASTAATSAAKTRTRMAVRVWGWVVVRLLPLNIRQHGHSGTAIDDRRPASGRR